MCACACVCVILVSVVLAVKVTVQIANRQWRYVSTVGFDRRDYHTGGISKGLWQKANGHLRVIMECSNAVFPVSYPSILETIFKIRDFLMNQITKHD